MVFLADPRPHLEVAECEQGKCVLSLQKVIPRPTGGRQTEGGKIRQSESKAKKGRKKHWVM